MDEIEFHISKFRSSDITVIEGTPSSILDILFQLSVESIIVLDRDTLFIDGWNSFNPYDILRISRSLDIKSNIEQRKILSRIHISRAFTEYQMDTLIRGLDRAVKEWNPAIIIISYLPNLFYGSDKNGKKLLKSSIERLKSITASSNIIAVVTSFGDFCYEDKFLASKADRIINIKKTKNMIKITDDGHISEYVPVPFGQTRFSDY